MRRGLNKEHASDIDSGNLTKKYPQNSLSEQQKSVEVQMGAHGPEAEVVAPRSERAKEIDHDQPTSSGILHHNVINGPLVIF
jgi:hypothetical protein